VEFFVVFVVLKLFPAPVYLIFNFARGGRPLNTYLGSAPDSAVNIEPTYIVTAGAICQHGAIVTAIVMNLPSWMKPLPVDVLTVAT